MVVKEVQTEHAIIRFHDTMFEDEEHFAKRIESIKRILTSAYKERILKEMEARQKDEKD